MGGEVSEAFMRSSARLRSSAIWLFMGGTLDAAVEDRCGRAVGAMAKASVTASTGGGIGGRWWVLRGEEDNHVSLKYAFGEDIGAKVTEGQQEWKLSWW